MKAAIFVGPGQLELQTIEDPTPGPGDVLLAVGANTLCGTDGRILRGEKTAGIDQGVVLGHEIAGYVVEIGSNVTNFSIGDLVAVLPTIPCGRCYFCRHGLEHLCVDSELFGYGVNGGLAEYVLVPERAIKRGGIYKAAPHLSPVEAALSEPLGCVMNGLSNYNPQVGETVVVMGAGPIGLLHTQACRLAGASQIIVSDPDSSRTDVALRLGATHTVNPLEDDLTGLVREATSGLGADIAVVCIGRPTLFNNALQVVRKGGRVNAFAGFSKDELAQIDPNLIHYGEITVTGASNAARADQELALQLIGDGLIDVQTLHTDTYALDDIEKAINYVSTGKGIKVAVTPDGTVQMS